MRYDPFWSHYNGVGQNTARNHGLAWAEPIMCNDPDNGECEYLFRSGSKYYLWNPIEGSVCEIVTSTGLVDIVKELGGPNRASLKLAEVHQKCLPTDFELGMDKNVR
jgi:hypothetical protein